LGRLEPRFAGPQGQKRAGLSLHPQRSVPIQEDGCREPPRVAQIRSDLFAHRAAPAEKAGGGLDPQGTLPILDDLPLLAGRRATSVFEVGESSVLPEEKPGALGRQPQPSGRSEKDGVYVAVAYRPAGYFLERLESDSIETENALRGREPEVSLG
jgi:hypothetical protein